MLFTYLVLVQISSVLWETLCTSVNKLCRLLLPKFQVTMYMSFIANLFSLLIILQCPIFVARHTIASCGVRGFPEKLGSL